MEIDRRLSKIWLLFYDFFGLPIKWSGVYPVKMCVCV
jgi:hypothetical protein